MFAARLFRCNLPFLSSLMLFWQHGLHCPVVWQTSRPCVWHKLSVRVVLSCWQSSVRYLEILTLPASRSQLPNTEREQAGTWKIDWNYFAWHWPLGLALLWRPIEFWMMRSISIPLLKCSSFSSKRNYHSTPRNVPLCSPMNVFKLFANDLRKDSYCVVCQSHVLAERRILILKFTNTELLQWHIHTALSKPTGW